MHVEELPREHAGAAARLANPAGLDGIITCGSYVLALRIGKIQVAGELFDLYGTVTIHDRSRGVDPLIRPVGENDYSSTPHSFDVGFRLRPTCLDVSEIPVETYLEVDVGDAQGPSVRHVQRLAQRADVALGETTGLKITDDLIGHALIFKQTHRCFRHIAPPIKVCVQPKLSRLSISLFSLRTGKRSAPYPTRAPTSITRADSRISSIVLTRVVGTTQVAKRQLWWEGEPKIEDSEGLYTPFVETVSNLGCSSKVLNRRRNCAAWAPSTTR